LISKQSGLISKQRFENLLPRIAKLCRAMPSLSSLSRFTMLI
jgi:hypothetical protein